MEMKRLLARGTCLVLAMCFAVALADGGMFLRRATYKEEDVLQPTQKVYIRWDGSQEILLIQTKYEGPAEEMVWIVPVPSEPTVEAGSGTIFEEFSEKTNWPDIAHTRFVGLSPRSFGVDPPIGGASFSAGGTPVVQWRRRIGDYDVVLLRPVGGEDVIHWLAANDFAMPDKAIPILEDYIRDGWWMVASKIHPDALTSITQEKLAKGMLHPLEMTFESPECLYPLRLTSMAAGPVEELIYIEGPAHYVPLTLAQGDWQIDIFGGPVRQVPQHYYQSDIEHAIEVLNGQTRTNVEPHLTKLRRVFQPKEMTDDIIFAPMDYSTWLESEDPLLIGQAATQYGRHRDPNGVPYLLKVLSSGMLKQVQPTPSQYQKDWLSPLARILTYHDLLRWRAYRVTHLPDGSERLRPIGDHIFSCIWAIGEIGVEHKMNDEVEGLLLECALHDNQLVRMEAYIALVKLGSARLGPILMDRLAYIPPHGPAPASSNPDFRIMTAEMNTVAEWIVRWGTSDLTNALAEALKVPISEIQGSILYGYVSPKQTEPTTSDWFEWVVWQAACTRNTSLIAPLQALHARLASIDQVHPALPFVLRAEAACSSAEAIDTLTREIIADETSVLGEGQGPVPEGMASLGSFYVPIWDTVTGKSLRVQIIQEYWLRYSLYPMPSEASDSILQSALSAHGFSDWYTLYILAQIKKPRAEDRERLTQMWDSGDGWLRLVVLDVLYAWDDGQTLLSLHEKAESDEVKSEIAWALANLGTAQAVHIVEEQAVGSWNTAWLDCGRPFLMRTWEDSGIDDPEFTDAMRKAEAVQTYFHPEWEALDSERLAALRRLGDNSEIHPGLRFELFVTDYPAKDWAKPLLKKAIRELLETHPDSSTASTLISRTDIQLVVDACGEPGSDEFRRDLIINLLSGGNVYNLPVIEGLLWEVWLQRYVETEGQSILFREPGDLAASLDYYCQHAKQTVRRAGSNYTLSPTEPVLQSLVNDDSLPAGYRAFLLVYWPTAPGWFSREFVKTLLEQDMPDFIRDALQQRLLTWG